MTTSKLYFILDTTTKIKGFLKNIYFEHIIYTHKGVYNDVIKISLGTIYTLFYILIKVQYYVIDTIYYYFWFC